MCMLWLQNRSVMSREGPRSLEEDEQTAPESLGVVGGLRQNLIDQIIRTCVLEMRLPKNSKVVTSKEQPR